MSSDSEDDCYGNVVQQLQKIKNQNREDKVENIRLFNDSYELDEIVKTHSIPAKKQRFSAGRRDEDTYSSSESDLLEVITLQNNSKRITRSSTKNNTSYNELPAELPSTRRRNAKRTRNATLDTSTGGASTSTPSRDRRGRGGRGSRGSRRGSGARSGRGSRPRGRGRQRASATTRSRRRDPISSRSQTYDYDMNEIPTFSVGNTDDYPDDCDNQVLFSNKATTADVVIIDDENSEENEELNVKVYWTSSEYHKFSIRRFQKISKIFDYFAKKENIDHDKLLFRLNGKFLTPNDTPDSIGYTISKIIDGGIVERGVSGLITRTDRVTSGMKLKFQCETLKKPFEFVIKPDEKFSLIMLKVAEYLEKPLKKLKFEFDGDSISGTSTAKDLELEGGECIDIKVDK